MVVFDELLRVLNLLITNSDEPDDVLLCILLFRQHRQLLLVGLVDRTLYHRIKLLDLAPQLRINRLQLVDLDTIHDQLFSHLLFLVLLPLHSSRSHRRHGGVVDVLRANQTVEISHAQIIRQILQCLGVDL